MSRETAIEILVYLLSALGVGVTLFVNARQQQVPLLSWQTATLIGIASVVFALTYMLVRWLAHRRE